MGCVVSKKPAPPAGAADGAPKAGATGGDPPAPPPAQAQPSQPAPAVQEEPSASQHLPAPDSSEDAPAPSPAPPDVIAPDDDDARGDGEAPDAAAEASPRVPAVVPPPEDVASTASPQPPPGLNLDGFDDARSRSTTLRSQTNSARLSPHLQARLDRPRRASAAFVPTVDPVTGRVMLPKHATGLVSQPASRAASPSPRSLSARDESTPRSQSPFLEPSSAPRQLLRTDSTLSMQKFLSASSPRRRASTFGGKPIGQEIVNAAMAQGTGTVETFHPLAFVTCSLDGRMVQEYKKTSIMVRGHQIDTERAFPPLRQLAIQEVGPLLLRSIQSERNAAILNKGYLQDQDKWACHLAAATGDIERLRAALGAGNCNLQDSDGHGAIHLAAFHGSVDCCRALLEAGARPDLADKFKRTPIHLAALSGHSAAIKVILHAADDKAALVNSSDKQEASALCYAIYRGHPKIVDLLIKVGADLAAPDRRGKTALHWAACAGNIDILNILLDAKIALDTCDDKGRTALVYAASAGNLACVKRLLEASPALLDVADKKGIHSLHWGAAGQYVHMVKVLLRAGANPNVRTLFRTTPLHYAALAGNVELVNLLLQFEATVDVADGVNKTPTLWAAFAGRSEVVTLLLERGATIGLKDLEAGANEIEWTLKSTVDRETSGLITSALAASKNPHRETLASEDAQGGSRSAIPVAPFLDRGASLMQGLNDLGQEAESADPTPRTTAPPSNLATARESLAVTSEFFDSDADDDDSEINALLQAADMIAPEDEGTAGAAPEDDDDDENLELGDDDAAATAGATGDGILPATIETIAVTETDVDLQGSGDMIGQMQNDIRLYQERLLALDKTDYVQFIVHMDIYKNGTWLEDESYEWVTSTKVAESEHYTKSKRKTRDEAVLEVTLIPPEEPELVEVRTTWELEDSHPTSFQRDPTSWDEVEVSVHAVSRTESRLLSRLRRSRKQLLIEVKHHDLDGWGTGCSIDVPRGKGEEPEHIKSGDQAAGWVTFFMYPDFKPEPDKFLDVFEDMQFSAWLQNIQDWADTKLDPLQVPRLVVKGDDDDDSDDLEDMEL